MALEPKKPELMQLAHVVVRDAASPPGRVAGIEAHGGKNGARPRDSRVPVGGPNQSAHERDVVVRQVLSSAKKGNKRGAVLASLAWRRGRCVKKLPRVMVRHIGHSHEIRERLPCTKRSKGCSSSSWFKAAVQDKLRKRVIGVESRGLSSGIAGCVRVCSFPLALVLGDPLHPKRASLQGPSSVGLCTSGRSASALGGLHRKRLGRRSAAKGSCGPSLASEESTRSGLLPFLQRACQKKGRGALPIIPSSAHRYCT